MASEGLERRLWDSAANSPPAFNEIIVPQTFPPPDSMARKQESCRQTNEHTGTTRQIGIAEMAVVVIGTVVKILRPADTNNSNRHDNFVHMTAVQLEWQAVGRSECGRCLRISRRMNTDRSASHQLPAPPFFETLDQFLGRVRYSIVSMMFPFRERPPLFL